MGRRGYTGGGDPCFFSWHIAISHDPLASTGPPLISPDKSPVSPGVTDNPPATPAPEDVKPGQSAVPSDRLPQRVFLTGFRLYFAPGRFFPLGIVSDRNILNLYLFFL